VTAERLLIRGGTVIDGSGGEPYVADVLLGDGVIAAVGTDLAPGRSGQSAPSGTRAGETGMSQIDATGLLVTPGFIDVHTHYDGQATWEHTLGPSGTGSGLRAGS
jgi:N-acyl-D-amino-acid deacylase